MPALETEPNKLHKRIPVDLPNAERERRLVEGAVGVVEEIDHFVSDAAGEHIRDVALELDPATHEGQYGLRVGKIADILEFVEHDDRAPAGRDFGQHVENLFHGVGVLRRARVESEPEFPRGRIDLHHRAQPRQKLQRLFEK